MLVTLADVADLISSTVSLLLADKQACDSKGVAHLSLLLAFKLLVEVLSVAINWPN